MIGKTYGVFAQMSSLGSGRRPRRQLVLGDNDSAIERHVGNSVASR
jgi:hypothetical protein